VGGVVAATAFFFSLLTHELAHALAARRHGVGTLDITLWLLGGVARLEGEAPTAGAEFQIAAAGPATSLGLGVVFGAAAFGGAALGVGDLMITVLAWLAVINVVLALFNLLPGIPLDGGRILTAGLWRLWGDRTRASVAAARSGQVLGGTLIAVPVLGLFFPVPLDGLWSVVMGAFLWQTAAAEGRSARVRGNLRGRSVRDLMVPVTHTNDWWTLDELARHGNPGDTGRALLLHDWSGAPSGILLPELAARVPLGWRGTVRLRDLALRPDQVRLAWADEPVMVALQRPGPASPVLVAVADGAVVGIVPPSALGAAARPAPVTAARGLLPAT
jgi:Zn-dependent protease